MTDAVLSSGASAEVIVALRARVGELPRSYEQFLQWSDGAPVGQWPIAGSAEAYLLDPDVTDRRVLVISLHTNTGDVIGLDISATNAKGEAPVVEFLHDPWSQRVVAKSFKGWLRTITSQP